MVSDDTEHTCLVGQALLCAPDDAERFARQLAWRLRWWLLALPAGVGLATARAILKLWLGFAPQSSGVYSAGNGPVMRASLLGVCLGRRPDRLRAYIRASTRLTHTDMRAERGALVVAWAAYYGALDGPSRMSASSLLALIREGLGDCAPELAALLQKVHDHLEVDAPAQKLAEALRLEKGVTGYVYHTVPLALYCWLRSPGDFRRAVEEVIALGGDTDTTGAIVGALAGATVGAPGIPRDWLSGICEWPRTAGWMGMLAARLAEQFPEEGEREPLGALGFFWPGVLARNLLFLCVVLLHGFRRMLPPY
jgi:ADP-ribosyl-[dinitrogen reductase] hydrolase